MLGRLCLRLLGWRIAGELPQMPKFILVIAPHTSNWDFVIGMATALKLDLRANWFAKHSLFCPPLKSLMIWLGGIPVDRRKPQGIIEQIADECNRRDQFLLAVTPEGTRGPVKSWKSGCYHIARSTGVPLVPAAIDYSTRTIRFFYPSIPRDNAELEMRRLSDLFQPKFARIEKNYLPHE